MRKTTLFTLIITLLFCVCTFCAGVYAAQTANMPLGGNISFLPMGVSATVSGTISGAGKVQSTASDSAVEYSSQTVNFPTMTFDANTQNDSEGTLSTSSNSLPSWKNNIINFDGDGSLITLTITIQNLSASNLFVRIDDLKGVVKNLKKEISTDWYLEIAPSSSSVITFTYEPRDKDKPIENVDFGYQITLTTNDLFLEENTDFNFVVLDETAKTAMLTSRTNGSTNILNIPHKVRKTDANGTLGEYTVTKVGDANYENVMAMGSSQDLVVTTVILPDSVTVLGAMAFESFTNLSNFTYSKNLALVYEDAFLNTNIKNIFIPASYYGDYWTLDPNCSAEYVDVADNGEGFAKVSDCIIDIDDGFLVKGFPTSIIPTDENLVAEITQYAFRGVQFTKNIFIPSNIGYIGGYAFANSSLTAIVIPSTVTAMGIGVFSGCTMLEGVYVCSSQIAGLSDPGSLLSSVWAGLPKTTIVACSPSLTRGTLITNYFKAKNIYTWNYQGKSFATFILN